MKRQFNAVERLIGAKCEACGVRARRRAKVENHHVNGNKHDNRRDNMVWLCLKCHKLISKSQKHGRPARRLQPKCGGEHVCENKAGAGSSPSRSETEPRRSSSEERGDEILKGLLRYLNEEAVPRGETRDEILNNAGPWINKQNPPSDPALRRRLRMFTESRYYPFRFDEHGRIYMEMAEPIRKEEANKG